MLKLGSAGNRWLILMAVSIYVLAAAVRLVFLMEARHSPLYQWPTIDEREHHELAVAIADGTLPPTPYVKAPGYFYLLGGIYKVFGYDSLRARFVQMFIFSLSPVLVFLIAHRLFGTAVGLTAGALASVFWTLVFFSTELLDISLACLLYLLLACLLVCADERRWWKWLACGIVLGVGAITRPNILAFVPVLAAIVLAHAWQRGRSRSPVQPVKVRLQIGLSKALQFVIGAAIAIAPVTLRNYFVSRERLLIGAWGSAVFYLTNNPNTDGTNVVRPTVRNLRPDLIPDPSLRNEGSQACYLMVAQHLGRRPTYEEVEQYYRRLSWEYLRQYPWKFLRDTGRRFCFLFNAYEYPFNKNIYQFCRFSTLLTTLSWLHYGIIAPIGLVGLIAALSRKPWPAGLDYHVALILTYAVPCIFFQIVSRYRIPLVYLLMPMVAYGVVFLAKLLIPPIQWRRTGLYLGGLTGLLVFSNVNVFGYRPAKHEYLPFYYAAACMATNRHDLVVEVSDEIEQALADPKRAANIPPNSMGPMFEYFFRHGDMPRAARYGRQMILRGESPDAEITDALVAAFIRVGWQADARQALNAVRTHPAAQTDPYAAQATLRYGRAYRDREALTAAVERYTALVERHPDEPKFRKALEVARKALGALATSPASAPASMSVSKPSP